MAANLHVCWCCGDFYDIPGAFPIRAPVDIAEVLNAADAPPPDFPGDNAGVSFRCYFFGYCPARECPIRTIHVKNRFEARI